MKKQFERTINLIGEENQKKLIHSNILVLGVGGVGGYVCEALARSGIGMFTLVDKDVVDESNINRQIIALNSTIGQPKVEIMKNRILDINPDATVVAIKQFLTLENITEINFKKYDYVIDAVDNVTVKIEVAKLADNLGFNLISCMGTGNKLCPEMFEVTDIYKTSVCPLAKIVRKKLKENNVKKLTVLYSKELPTKTNSRTPASISFCPSIAGLRIAEYVIKELIK